ncbi:ABC transporter ATP-binding protein [Thermomicrobium sp. 4228-Ro]|uniref:ABC transporter ATP-binding protein n=1 Tax=Thermomicrobium sp. 4228-Ro TaxID=2993937 RepID=UPI0022492F81|nr:ABC transporter ATP-binding protein [Thermomicrobium sp. 4228-Ro]MCX2728071.1 ABC transporter ATP-binding protein [Thermomicrobium sp. 4228-Ro]
MARVELVEVTKRYGQTIAVDRVSLDIAEGEFVTLLGPSGCGKTTTLRMIAGLIEPSDGEIRFDGRVVNHIPPHKRNIGFVFQFHALFPHMTVADNIAFGLKIRGRPKAEIAQRVEELLELVNLQGFGTRLPAQLSGGQQQRVALARVLATDPQVLLFDEPLSALDRNLRDQLKYSILELQRRTRKTAIYVTHDQSEAFAISDRICVMNAGRVEQVGTPVELYLQPRTEFVANFVGDNNVLRGLVVRTELRDDGQRGVLIRSNGIELHAVDPHGLQIGDPAVVFVRPENIEIVSDDPIGSPDTLLEGLIDQVIFEGPTVRVVIDVHGVPIRVVVSGPQRLTLLGRNGRRVYLRPHAAVAIRDTSVVESSVRR